VSSNELRATYRLQLTPSFGFAAARELVPYLAELGVSHLYLSPSFEARRGSQHGYDVTDPTRIREELGGEAEFRALCAAGLGVVLDIVPNHMAASDENPFWTDPDLHTTFFDVDRRTGHHRRFFDIGELIGVRQEDEHVFQVTHAKVLELVAEGLVDGVRVDHPDGLANPRQYFDRLGRAGVERVWIEKILEPGEHLRAGWPVQGTTGYEFANDSTALFVDPRGEEPLTRLYEELTGETRSFEEIAFEAKLEVATTVFEPELRRLHQELDVPNLPLALASFHVYRTYVEPFEGVVADEDRYEIGRAALSETLERILLLEEPGHEVFVTEFQQTTGPVMAKGVEDTAFYRYLRLAALNEVGGNPGRFSLGVDEFHRGNLEREARFPLHLLATTTHDTKRSGDVRARIAALAGLAGEWAEHVRRWPRLDDANESYLVYQTLVGAWPLEVERLEAYMEKALREAKRSTSWIEPNEEHERRVREFCRALYEDAAWRGEFEPFAARVAEEGRRISLGMTLVKLTAPGVPDIYQGDELESLSLVDPDNRRPVDWELRRRLLRERGDDKQELIRRVLAVRDEFGAYEPIEAGPDVLAFRRGPRRLVVVPLRPGGSKRIAESEPLTDLLPEYPVGLFSRV
jgi:(1->4)-alpha-D-glucan 1-alpha-D-glucosylmutase